jgi:glycosyltransferase involved in cell wall biosynthesis
METSSKLNIEAIIADMPERIPDPLSLEEFIYRYEHKPVKEYPNQIADMPLVSVCIETYNQADYIENCMDSVLMQQLDFPLEILVGEDDSTDGTREICKKYAEKYPDKIRLFLHSRENNIKKHRGPTGVFNKFYNLYSARGKYITFCEGDDYWTDSLKLKKQVDFLEQNEEYSGCIGNIIRHNHITNNKRTKSYQRIISTEDIINGKLLPFQSLMYRKNVGIQQYTNFRGLISEPHRLYNYVIAMRGPVYCLDEVLAVYNITGKGIWTKFHNLNQSVLVSFSLSRFHRLIGLNPDNKYIRKYIFKVVSDQMKGNHQLTDKYIRKIFGISKTRLWYFKLRIKLAILKNNIKGSLRNP